NLDGNDRSGNDSSNNNGGFWFHNPAPPDVILLLIGGRDIGTNFQISTMAQRYDELIGQILADSPTTLLFVSTLLPAKNYSAAQNQLAQAFNLQLRDVIVPKYASLGANVILVDRTRLPSLRVTCTRLMLQLLVRPRRMRMHLGSSLSQSNSSTITRAWG